MILFTFTLHDHYGMFVVAIPANCYADAHEMIAERYGSVTIRNVISEEV